jgi:aminoglycoside phosphotransferase family enzyme/predicted kinase
MTEQHQIAIFEAMESPDFYPHAVSTIEQRDTHISKVFLTGTYAYKIKKPVNLEFLDFTTLEKRRHFCWQEVVLNRRLAPTVYLDVVAITLKDGRYYLEGLGRPVEYAVKMRQLPQNRSMLHLIRKGKLEKESIDELARILAKFYCEAATGEKINNLGSWDTVWNNCEENFRQTKEFVGNIINEQMFLIIRAATRAFLLRRKTLFQRRMEGKRIRDCHGDLRTGHIYFTDGIQIIDGIEFNERFRYSDITSDLAFLAMDLDYEGSPETAHRLFHSYVQYTKDHDVFVLLDFYKCYRAYVRVKVNCFRLQDSDLATNEKGKLLREIHRYMDLAYQYAVQYTRPTIWVVCGLPASGKSTIAKGLSKTLSVKVVRSDIVRKKLFGLKLTESLDLPFEEGIYSKNASSLTYGKLLMLTQEEVEKGCSVILDATFSREHQRDEVIRLARDMDANILFVESVSPLALLKKRLTKRERTATFSDARVHHLTQLNAHLEPLNEISDELHIRVNTATAVNDSMRQILAHDYVLLSRQTAEAMESRSI